MKGLAKCEKEYQQWLRIFGTVLLKVRTNDNIVPKY